VYLYLDVVATHVCVVSLFGTGKIRDRQMEREGRVGRGQSGE